MIPSGPVTRYQKRMKELYRKIVRSCGKLTDILPLAALLSFILALAGTVLSAVIQHTGAYSSFIGLFTRDQDVVVFIDQYFSFMGIWILAIILMLVFPSNRPMWKAFSHNSKGNSFRALLIGALLGFGTNGLCVLVSWIMGDIKLSYSGFDAVLVLGFIIAIFIQSGAEEICDRLYLYQKLRRRYRHPAVAVLVNSIVFAALHIANPGFTVIAGCQIFMVGLLFSLLVYYYDSLWAAMGFHMAWNFTQNILFGLPNSGIVSKYSIFRLEAASARDGLFYNVNFGVEGSIGASLVLLAVAVAIIVRNRGKGECWDHWAEMEAAGDLKREQRDAQKESGGSAQAQDPGSGMI